jgi:CHAD domain-containing protein
MRGKPGHCSPPCGPSAPAAGLVCSPPSAPTGTSRFWTTRHGRSLADKAFAKLRKAVDELPEEPADEELHAVRKKGKRARYAAELAGRKKFVRHAKKLQDVLGEHQDAVVAAERLRELATNVTPEQALAAGRLVEREQANRADVRAAWRKAWKNLRKQI